MTDSEIAPTSILIPVALDHQSMVTRKLALARRMLAPGGRITLLTVIEQIPGFASEFVAVTSESHLSERVLEDLREAAGDAGDVEYRVTSGKPGMRIAQIATELGADLIIVGAHSPGAMEYFLGSTASRVARRAPCSVYILRE